MYCDEEGETAKLPCVRMLVHFPTEFLVHKSDGWYRSESQQNQSPVDQRGDGIPPQAAIKSYMEGYSLLQWPLFHLKDIARKVCLFFFF